MIGSNSCPKWTEKMAQLGQLDGCNQIITKLLEPKNIQPVIVGGLSVEIYTQNDDSTRDIDFVSDGYHIIEDILFSLGFKKEDRHF